MEIIFLWLFFWRGNIQFCLFVMLFVSTYASVLRTSMQSTQETFQFICNLVARCCTLTLFKGSSVHTFSWLLIPNKWLNSCSKKPSLGFASLYTSHDHNSPLPSLTEPVQLLVAAAERPARQTLLGAAVLLRRGQLRTGWCSGPRGIEVVSIYCHTAPVTCHVDLSPGSSLLCSVRARQAFDSSTI